MRLLRETLSSMPWRYAGFVLASLAFGLSMLLPAEFFRYFAHEAPSLDEITATVFLHRLTLFGVAIAFVSLICAFGATLCNEWLRLRMEADLRRKTLLRLHQLPLTVLDGAQRGDWLTRMTSDLDHVELFCSETLPKQIQKLAVLLGSGALFIAQSRWLAVIPLSTAMLLAYVNYRVQRRLSPVLSELRNLHGGVFQFLIESLEGIRTVRSHSVEPFVQRRFDERLAEITSKSMRVSRTSGALIGGTELASQLMVTGCLTAVVWAMSKDSISLQQALVYPFFIGLFYGAAQFLATGTYDWGRFFVEGGRLGDLLYREHAAVSRVLSPVTRSQLERSQALSVSSLLVTHGSQVTIGPLDFKVKRGEMWTIMGPSGSGKSTFLEVVAGLRAATSGKLSVQGEDGSTIWESSLKEAVKMPIGPCAFVEQHPYIFEGSLRDNLTFGNPDRLSDAVLWEALERSSLYGFARLYGGLDYVLKDRGRNISHGERYRIALCRALLLRRPFLLLDEPFASLDEKSVEVVIATLEQAKPTSGIVVVTHYLPQDFEIDGIVDFTGLNQAYQVKQGGVAALAPVSFN